MTTEALVDALQEIDKQAVGLHGTAWVSAFIAEDMPPKFGGGVLGSAAPAEFAQMRELVRRGVSALPTLLKHVDDSRPTRLVIGRDGFPFMFSCFSDEYDPRWQKDIKQSKELHMGDPVPLPYTVLVGDVCFAVIGQIINRNLMPLRYQPTGGLVVNSPVRDKALSTKVRADWLGLSSATFREALLLDVNDITSVDGALLRLRFYFPDEYRRQKAGALKQQIEAFEAKKD